MSEQEQGIAAPVTAHVQVVLDATGAHGTVVVDGTDVSKRVKSVHLTAEAGRPAQVVLIANADGFSYEGPGVVKVVQEVSAPWAQQALDWLDGLDLHELEKLVAEGTMARPLGTAIYEALAGQLQHLLTGKA